MSDLWDVAGIARLQRACATRPSPRHAAAAAAARTEQEADIFAAIRESGHPRPSPLRLVHHLGGALRQAGVGGSGRAGDQADRLPDERRLPAGPVADRGGRARQAGGVHGGAEGALRRAGEHPVGEEAGGGGRARRLRPARAEEPRQVHPGRPSRGRRGFATTRTSAPAITTPRRRSLYTDFGLFTADPEIGNDIAEMFNYMTGYSRPRDYRKVLVAPFNLFEGIIGEIERTIESHSADHPARIRLKMNSLLDAAEIRALYRASQAGVECPAQRPRDLRPAARRAWGLGQHPGRLGRGPLPRALADLLVRTRRGAGARVHRARPI